MAPFVSQAQPTANPPGQISYQGFLTDANGIPLATNTPKNYTIVFRIWDASTGGSNIWAEQQIVTVDRGYFTVMLGVGTSYPGAPFTNNLSGLFSGSSASDRYIGITATDLSANEIAPRLRLLASPYSFLASTALSALSVAASGSVPDSSLSPNVALRAGGNNFTGVQTVNGTVTATAFSGSGAGLTGVMPASGSTNYVQNQTNADQAAGLRISGNAIFNGGRVGIGTISPSRSLEVHNAGDTEIGIQSTDVGSHLWSLQSSSTTNSSSLNASFQIVDRTAGASRFYINPTNGNVGISTTTSGKLLQIGSANDQVDGMIRLACGTGGINRTWDIGVPYGGTNIGGTNYSFVIADPTAGIARLMIDWNTGDVCIGTTSPVSGQLLTVGSAYCNGTTWVNGSDRNIKEGFAEIDTSTILNKVSALPITEWNYKAEPNGTRHLGPVAQDFHEAFGLNGSDDTHIATIDESGVALAAIQGLNQKLEQRLEQKETEITELKARLDKLEQLLNHTTNGAAR
jgi:hypothetical protein